MIFKNIVYKVFKYYTYFIVACVVFFKWDPSNYSPKQIEYNQPYPINCVHIIKQNKWFCKYSDGSLFIF